MTHVERIAELPSDQRRAARALMTNADDVRVADAVHADVPDGIVSYLSGLSVERVHAVADAVAARERRLAVELSKPF
jgi:hypothetical protein